MVSGMIAVIYFGLQPRPVQKVQMSTFPTANHVANAVLLALPQELQESSLIFIGANPQDPFLRESLEAFLILAQSQPIKFDAVLADESFSTWSLPQNLSFEHFPIREQESRFIGGLSGVLEKKLRLLVLVPTVEASHKLPGSLLSSVQEKYPQVPILGLLFANFPRSREQEKSMQIPCNTGSHDQGQVASVGCLILQSSRALYRKHYPEGKWVGFLDQVGSLDFVFLLTKEQAASASAN